ncbi:MAG: efflux RND transporter periplasmic adaptor subunit [Croceitalea sp.]|nr:efflux RND transporter periplasmic adaptor subunit [Croceitalea sp.]NNL09932.1 efflux RND transporter periplasmic adaptor subunit [Croceitalea sp.]
MKNRIYIIGAALCILFAVSCKETSNGNQLEDNGSLPDTMGYITITSEQFKNQGMKLGVISQRTFTESVKANGFIDVPPKNRAIVSAIMGGFIKRTPLLIGDKVTRGQALVVLENPEFVALQQEYLEVQAELNYLKEAYERQKTLFDENISSEKGFLRTKSEYDMKMATFKGLEKQLDLLNISTTSLNSGNIRSTVTLYAPIGGSITNVHISKGSYVSPNTPIMEIINGDHMHLELSVFERDVMKIKKGQKIEFMIPEASDERYEADVHLVGTSINSDKTIKVHGHIKDKDKHNFITGMFVSTHINTREVELPSIPSEAIVTFDNEAFVLRLMEEKENNYVFKKIKVDPGASNGDYTGLNHLGPLTEDASILVKGAFIVMAE